MAEQSSQMPGGGAGAKGEGIGELEAHKEQFGALLAAIDAAEAAEATDPDAGLAGLEERLTQEKGTISRIRELSLPARVAFGAGGFGLLSAAVLLTMPRADLAVFPLARLGIVVGILALLAIVALSASLRPMWLPRLTRSQLLVLVGVGVLVPFVLPMLPEAHHAHEASEGGHGDELWMRAIPCLIFGLATALPVLLLGWLLDRGGHHAAARAALAAVTAGLAGEVALNLHCPLTSPEHLLVGHAGIVAILAAAYFLFRRLRS